MRCQSQRPVPQWGPPPISFPCVLGVHFAVQNRAGLNAGLNRVAHPMPFMNRREHRPWREAVAHQMHL